MSLQILVSGLLLVTAASVTFAAPDEPFYRQDESAQHFVLEKGQTFRLFQHNTLTWGQGAQWDTARRQADVDR